MHSVTLVIRFFDKRNLTLSIRGISLYNTVLDYPTTSFGFLSAFLLIKN